jgi:serine/threonine protein kinase
MDYSDHANTDFKLSGHDCSQGVTRDAREHGVCDPRLGFGRDCLVFVRNEHLFLPVINCLMNNYRDKLTPQDFETLKLLGRGATGKVFQVRKRDTMRVYAMKVVLKKDVSHTIGERQILQRVQSPFLVGLRYSFQTEGDLYLVMDFKSGGELFWHLQQERKFSEETARFYTAELVLALDHLHKYDIVHRYVSGFFLYSMVN